MIIPEVLCSKRGCEEEATHFEYPQAGSPRVVCSGHASSSKVRTEPFVRPL